MEDIIDMKFSKRTGLKLRPGETEEDAPVERAPLNTTAQDPLFLLMTMMGGASEGIERMERDGQRELNGTSTIPTRYLGFSQAEGKALLCRAGFEIGKEVEGDYLFQYCRLPEGWKKVATDHPMWSNIEDEKGHCRGAIFYKAAFYDRSAHMSLNPRLAIQEDYSARSLGILRYQVVARMDGNNVRVLHTVERTNFPKDSHGLSDTERLAYFQAMDALPFEAKAWLAENFPEYKDELAYWDVDFGRASV